MIRRSIAIGVFLIAVAMRAALGPLAGANPAIIFYPAVLLSAVLLGWFEAGIILLLSIAAGVWFFLPPGMYLLPAAWLFVGSFSITLITALINVTAELAATNERQKVLFQEVQHRVANTLQSVNGTLAAVRRQMVTHPAEATRLIDEAMQRFAASADIHRRLHDPSLFHRNLSAILADAVATVIDTQTVTVSIDVEPIDLNFDQFNIITMLVIELANNAQKHVFHEALGRHFLVRLRDGIGREAILTIKDDGPGWVQSEAPNRSLGVGIVRALSAQLGGTMAIRSEAGTETVVRFPVQELRVSAS